MAREIISTDEAPAAIGSYSQAITVDNTVYLSGQIPLDPETMELIGDDIREQITRVFKNLKAVVKEAGGSFADVVKLTIFLTDLHDFPILNEIMAEYFHEPYPARTTIGVSQLPKGSQVEMDAIMVLNR